MYTPSHGADDDASITHTYCHSHGTKKSHSWEQRQLSDVSTYKVSSLTTDKVCGSGKYKVFDANAEIGFTNGEKINNEYLTIIKDGSGVGRTRKLPGNTYFIGTMGGILPKSSDVNWLYALMQKFDFSLYINGATIPHVYYSDYSKEEINVPSLREQTKIGSLFENIDSLITLHQRERSNKF